MWRRWLWGLALVPLTAVALVAAETSALPSHSYDWPQWQGPERNARSRETGLLQDWPKDGPPRLWTVHGLGAGFSTPSVAAGRIFTMGDRPDENKQNTEYVIALDEETGKELWSTPLGPGGEAGGFPGPRCTPTVDGEVLYALGLKGELVCLETATGKEHWRKSYLKDFHGSMGGWGYTESPLVDGDRLLCTPGGKTATLVALDKKTGETVWKAAVPGGDGAAYSSVIVADVGGEREYIQFLSGGVVGVRAEDGKFLWRYAAPSAGINCSTPVFAEDNVFASAGYGKGGGLVHLEREGETVKAREVYFSKGLKNHHGGLVLVDGYLYGADDPNTLVCLDFKTGKEQWRSTAPGKGSVTYADGRLYYRNEGGPIVLVEATPKGYTEHGRFNQPERSKRNAWPHPVIANGKLYIRDQDVLLCYDVKQK